MSQNENGCDESKCLSTGLMPVTDGDQDSSLIFNCYGQGPGSMYPFICADDYVGVPISNNTTNTRDPNVQYYTCCPDPQPDPPPVRECQNPLVYEENMGDMDETCSSQYPSYPYGRSMTYVPGLPQAYVCCNVDLDPPLLGAPPPAMPSGVAMDAPMEENNTTTVEEPQECYPFVFCGNCTVENSFGDIEMMNCYNDVYRYPQIMISTGNTATYQCCSEPPSESSSPPLILTSTAYLATIWTQFALAFIASWMSLLLIVAVGRSLYLARRPSKAPSISRSRARNPPDYSSYNLYLIFLAIPDLMYNWFMLGIVSDAFYNGWLPQNDALITFCAVLNQYMSAIIAHEVLVLLQRTKVVQRYIPPSFKKAWIQFGVVALYATILSILWYLLLHYFMSSSSSHMLRATVAIPLRNISIPIFYTLVVGVPAAYLLYVCLVIWWKKLLPKGQIGRKTTTTTTTRRKRCSNEGSTVRRSNGQSSSAAATRPTVRTTTTTSTSTVATPVNTGKLNVLAIYFARIILVFFFIWLPGMIMYYIGYTPNRNAGGLLHNIGMIFLSLQAIVSSGMAYTKPDVHKAICDLYSATIGQWWSSHRPSHDPSPPQGDDVEAAPISGQHVVTHEGGDPISAITTTASSSHGHSEHDEQRLPPTAEEEDLYLPKEGGSSSSRIHHDGEIVASFPRHNRKTTHGGSQ